jgi:hypothetical protein
MSKKLSVSLIALLSALLFSPAGLAETEAEAAKPAKLIIYRADEGSRTRAVKFHVRLDQLQIGRLKYGNAIVTSVSPGEYKLDTSLRGTSSLELDLKPGQTYFVHTSVDALGRSVTPVLKLVEEQVAVTHQPAISTAI